MTKRSVLIPLYTCVLILIWTLSWSVRKIGLGYTPPLVFAGLYSVGGALLLAAGPNRRRLRWRENWPVYAWSAFFNVVLFVGLQIVALKLLPSGLLTVLVYIGPVLAGFLASRWLGETLSGPRAAGLLLGFAGVILASLEGFIGRTSLTGILLGVGSGVAWGVGTVYTRHVHERVDVRQLVTGQFLLGSPVLLAAGLILGQWPHIRWTWPLLLSLAFSMLLAVPAAWSIWIYLLHSGEVARVSAAVFSIPILAVIIGVLGLGEPFSWLLMGGMACTAAGIYLVNRPAEKAAASPPPGNDESPVSQP